MQGVQIIQRLTVLHAVLAGTIVGELVGGTKSKVFADGMSQAETKLPRSVHFELIAALSNIV